MNALLEVTIFLLAATVAVPLFRRLGFGAVLGYLAAGVLIGPSGLRLIPDVENVLHFSEIGVVFLLFIIGLELQLSRLWVLRRAVFGLGAAQVLTTTLVLSLLAALAGLDAAAAVVAGFGLSLSSTAFVLQLLAEQKRLTAPHGRAAFGILLFQDLAVIPVLALVPLLGPSADAGSGMALLGRAAQVIAVLVVFLVGGRLLLRPALRVVAAAGTHEIFTAAALLLVLGSALIMESVGLSAGLGGFLAGVLVADSQYTHQLEADIEPFKGLLLGLFFVAVGMSANLQLIATQPVVVIGLAGALVLVKFSVIYPLGRAYGLRAGEPRSLALVLAQGGEFAFVLFNLAAQEALLPLALTELLVLAVTLSMAATPLLVLLVGRWTRGVPEQREFDEVDETEPRVIIAGFGRFGQIVGRLLASQRIRFTALEISAGQVDFVRRFGNKIYYGDASRLDLLRAARAERATVFVLAVDDVEASMKIAATVTRHFPKLTVYARARNRQHVHALMALDIRYIVRETLGSSLHLSGEVLSGLGLEPEAAAQAVEVFRRHDQQALERQFAIRHDEQALIQSARDSARELQALFESDRGRD